MHSVTTTPSEAQFLVLFVACCSESRRSPMGHPRPDPLNPPILSGAVPLRVDVRQTGGSPVPQSGLPASRSLPL